MRYAKTLELHNWGPFKGTHTLDLEATVYAVQAKHESDPDRSNWIGKTWFLSSMLFALTGQKPETCKTEDGMVTRGESEMYVKMIADDGTIVKRSRKLTRSTQLELTLPGYKVQKQTVAQDNLYDAMGMDADDLLATAFIQQKQIARLITADPSVRAGIVNGWIELGPLQDAEAWLRKEHNELLDEERRISPGEAPEGDLDALRGDLKLVQLDLDDATAERDTLHAQVSKLVEHKTHEYNVGRLEEIRKEGIQLRTAVDAFEAPDTAALLVAADKAYDAKGSASDREAQLRELLHGDWDGKCPLTCEGCPVQEDVKTQGASMEIEHGESEIILDEAAAASDEARKAHRTAQGAVRTQEDREGRLTRLRDNAAAMLPSVAYIDEHGAAASADEHQEKVRALDGEIRSYDQDAASLAARIAEHERHATASLKAATRRQELEGELRTHREAIAVVGRLGAQKEVAEVALGRIQRGANKRLGDAGIDLTVEVAWAREGRGLASHCDACGSAHPKSLKVKTCGICGATRGPKLVEKLEIVPSDRSGAADDITGLVFQLSASAWLRQKRSASWASACIDEPFASLDKANSRALGTHLHSLIRGNNDFDQGFLVAHDAAAMESLPATIQIYGGPDGAAVEVV